MVKVDDVHAECKHRTMEYTNMHITQTKWIYRLKRKIQQQTQIECKRRQDGEKKNDRQSAKS